MLSWRFLAAFAAAATVWAFALWSGPITNLRPTTKAELAQTITLPAPKDGRARPLIAIVADNAGTETTDFLVPLGILRAAGVADVVTVSTLSEPVTLMPALTVLADMTLDDFTAAYPAGADVVIVPALHDPNTPAIVDWLKQQHAQGATVMTICEGAWVAAAAGVLDGKRPPPIGTR
ncbi:DJ-1/PfpI family protein [Tabrizicola sp.]|uniref:DJ-1/PfpI family protein n=1 Tax=Tabrizicola sp. TaxID=2005166 RepID=UPI00286CE275|nr:DJ-1/PfpI family protein [Tabrizicola sp.]